MTPPENTERSGSDQAADGTDVAPPWQRVAKDTGGDAGQWSGGEAVANSEAPTAYYSAVQPEQNGSASRADTQVVTGTAAAGLFGGEQQEPPQQPQQPQQPQAGGQQKRSTPVSALRRPGRGPRRASLQVKRIDPWSVLKLALVLGVALFLVWLVAVGVLYTVLDGMGVWDKVNGTYTSLVQGETAESSGEPLISVGRVFGVAAIVGAINIVLISALATVSAFIYNVSADLAGGLEVTLSERE